MQSYMVNLPPVTGKYPELPDIYEASQLIRFDAVRGEDRNESKHSSSTLCK